MTSHPGESCWGRINTHPPALKKQQTLSQLGGPAWPGAPTSSGYSGFTCSLCPHFHGSLSPSHNISIMTPHSDSETHICTKPVLYCKAYSLFPKLGPGSPLGARCFCPSTTQLIKIIKAWRWVGYLYQLCSAKFGKPCSIGTQKYWVWLGWPVSLATELPESWFGTVDMQNLIKTHGLHLKCLPIPLCSALLTRAHTYLFKSSALC